MPRTFKVEILKNCKACTSPLSGRFRTYCSKPCRDKMGAALFKARRPTYSRDIQRKYREKSASPSPDKLPCAICGKFYRRPVRHANQRHGVTEREYKQAAGLDVTRGVITPEARERMAEHVRTNGTINNLEAGAPHRWTKDNPPPAYERSPETMERLRIQGLKIAEIIKNKHKK